MSVGGKTGGRLSVEIIGEKELIAALKLLADDGVLSAFHKASDEAADIVLAEAKARAPVKTGRLREGLVKLQNYKGKKGTLIRVGTSDEAMAAGQVNTKDNRQVYYGILVEYGRPGVPAHPFLRPALDENESKINELFKKALEEAVDKVDTGVSL